MYVLVSIRDFGLSTSVFHKYFILHLPLHICHLAIWFYSSYFYSDFHIFSEFQYLNWKITILKILALFRGYNTSVSISYCVSTLNLNGSQIYNVRFLILDMILFWPFVRLLPIKSLNHCLFLTSLSFLTFLINFVTHFLHSSLTWSLLRIPHYLRVWVLIHWDTKWNFWLKNTRF